MLTTRYRSRPATPGRDRSPHSITNSASHAPSTAGATSMRRRRACRDRRAGGGVAVDDARRLARGVEGERHRDLRSDRIAVGARVRRQEEVLRRARTTSQISAMRGRVLTRGLVVVARGASSGACGSFCGMDFLDERLDALAPLDRLVVLEVQLGRAAQAEALRRSGGAGTAWRARAPSPSRAGPSRRRATCSRRARPAGRRSPSRR